MAADVDQVQVPVLVATADALPADAMQLLAAVAKPNGLEESVLSSLCN